MTLDPETIALAGSLLAINLGLLALVYWLDKRRPK